MTGTRDRHPDPRITAHWVVSTGVRAWVQVEKLGAHFSLASPAFLVAPEAVAMAFVHRR